MKQSSLLPLVVSLMICGLCVAVAAYTYWDVSQPQLANGFFALRFDY